MRDVKGTGGVAARSVLPRRDGSSRTLYWVMPKWAVCNPGYGGQGGGKGLSMDLGQEPGRDAPIAHQTPFSCFFWGKIQLPPPLQPVWAEVSFPQGLSTGQDTGPWSSPAPPSLSGQHQPGMDPSPPSPCATPAWQPES